MRAGRARGLIAAAVGLALVLLLGRSAAVFYTDLLWFDAVGQGGVFWKRLWTSAGVRLVTGAVAAAIILANVGYVLRQLGPVHLRRRYGNLEIAEQVPRRYLVAAAIAAAVLAGWWLSSLQFGGYIPVAVLAWLRHESWGVSDPLFGRDMAFYVFSLPLYIRLLDYLLIVLLWSLLLVGIGYVLVGAVRVRGARWQIEERPRLHFAGLVAGMLLVLGVRLLLGRYQLLLDGGGFGGTIGYTDVHARLPARLVLALLVFASAGALVYGAVRRLWAPPALAAGILLLVAAGMGIGYPAFVQKVQVEPNQLAREAEYIGWNMEFTRRAYGLDTIQRRRFAYRRPDAEVWQAMEPALAELPLWDPGPLQTGFNEVQAQRDYYHFPDVDHDRYGPPGARRQVAIGVREVRREGMSASARTWSNLRLNPVYTRGLGAVVAPATGTNRGEPVYWLSDLAPVQRHPQAPPELELTEPSIYFGETTRGYAVVGHSATFSAQRLEADGRPPSAPRVDTGVQLASFARVLAFAWRFGDQNLLFARELTDTSRLIFRRAVHERVSTLAPFLLWDPDPHPMILDGRVVWMLDGYSASAGFPLSRPFTIADVGTLRYVRSSVKATVDAVTGEVAMYAVPDADPITRTYRRIFPGLLRDWNEMPDDVRAQLRYPGLLFRLQADVLEEYHLDNPRAFYAGQDVWQLPQEISPQARVRFRPGFVMAPLPGSAETEFLLMHSFIAYGRQNLTALLVARSDPPHYGELMLLEMPRDDQIKGPAQVQSIIEQDPVTSRELSLWRQRGSNVEMGRLRIIPTENSILYIEPLFLSAQQSGIPQLQRVIVSDGTAVAMADDLPSAMAALHGDAPPRQREPQAAATEPGAQPRPAGIWSQRALDLMREADASLRNGDFAAFGAAWARLRALLEERADTLPRP